MAERYFIIDRRTRNGGSIQVRTDRAEDAAEEIQKGFRARCATTAIVVTDAPEVWGEVRKVDGRWTWWSEVAR